MQTLGINYDTGVVVDGTSTRAGFDDRTVRRELEIIAGDLHANAVRVTGDQVDRLEVAARHASAAGLQVWFSPFLYDLGPDELVERLAACAARAEHLRRAGADLVLVLGGEISLFCSGFVPGEGLFGRLATMTDPATWTTPDGRAALGAGLGRARDTLRTVAARAVFGGPITYASGDLGGDRLGAVRHRLGRRLPRRPERPEVRRAGPRRDRTRALLPGTAGPLRPRGRRRRLLVHLRRLRAPAPAADPRHDLDLASYGLVAVLDDGHGTRYPDMGWERKRLFDTLATRYAGQRGP